MKYLHDKDNSFSSIFLFTIWHSHNLGNPIWLLIVWSHYISPNCQNINVLYLIHLSLYYYIISGLLSHLSGGFWLFAPTFWEVVETYKWYFCSYIFTVKVALTSCTHRQCTTLQQHPITHIYWFPPHPSQANCNFSPSSNAPISCMPHASIVLHCDMFTNCSQPNATRICLFHCYHHLWLCPPFKLH